MKREKELVKKTSSHLFKDQEEEKAQSYNIQLADIIKSHKRTGFLKKQTPIIDSETLKIYTIPKDIYVKFFTLQDKDGYYYLSSKDNIFKVRSKYIAHINEITNLYEPPTKFTDWSQRRIDLEKKETIYDYAFLGGLNFAYGHNGFFQKLTQDDSAKLVSYKAVDGQLLKELENFGAIGLGINLENATIPSSFSANTLSLEFIFESPPFVIKEIPLNIKLVAGSSLVSKLEDKVSSNEYNLSQNYLDIKLERAYPFAWGEFILGTFYQRKWLRVNKSKSEANISPKDNNENLLGLSLMFKKGISW